MVKSSTLSRCGAQLRKKPGRYCQLRSGYKTPHLGEGKCYLHGGLTPIRTGRYSSITHTRLRHLMDALDQQDTNVLDLEPEAKLMRAMVIDYINRYDAFVDELHLWAAATQKARGKGAPPPKLEILSLHDARDLVEGVSRIVEKIHKITASGAISLDTFRRVMEQMGLVVATHVSDPDTLRRIQADWGSVIIDAKSFARSNDAEADAEDPA
jgi:hypothetical protein